MSSRKNTVYVVMAVARGSGLIVGQAVSQDRGLETLQAFADTLPPATRYATDGHAAYAELVWPEAAEHVVSHGKEETYTIESLNANFAHLPQALSPPQPLFQSLPGGLTSRRSALRLLLQSAPVALSCPSQVTRTSPSAQLATPVDSQSVKTTSVVGVRGYDGAKKLVGRKRHVLVDPEGLLHAVNMHAADIMDRDGIKLVLSEAVRGQLPCMQLLWLDAGYNGRGKGKDWVEQTTAWRVETVKGIHWRKYY